MINSALRELIHQRAVLEANFIVENESTIRVTAEEFGVSKSTVHRDLQKFLKEIDIALYEEVITILKYNRSERHKRGGEANRVRAEKERMEREA